MQQQPLDYARPSPRGKPPVRRAFGRVVIGAWVLTVGAHVFGIVNSSDRNPLQWPAAIFAGFVTIATLGVTLFHWLVLVPVLWFRYRRAARSLS